MQGPRSILSLVISNYRALELSLFPFFLTCFVNIKGKEKSSAIIIHSHLQHGNSAIYIIRPWSLTIRILPSIFDRIMGNWRWGQRTAAKFQNNTQTFRFPNYSTRCTLSFRASWSCSELASRSKALQPGVDHCSNWGFVRGEHLNSASQFIRSRGTANSGWLEGFRNTVLSA